MGFPTFWRVFGSLKMVSVFCSGDRKCCFCFCSHLRKSPLRNLEMRNWGLNSGISRPLRLSWRGASRQQPRRTHESKLRRGARRRYQQHKDREEYWLPSVLAWKFRYLPILCACYRKSECVQRLLKLLLWHKVQLQDKAPPLILFMLYFRFNHSSKAAANMWLWREETSGQEDSVWAEQTFSE